MRILDICWTASEGFTYISATDKNGNTAYAPIWVESEEKMDDAA